MADSNDDDDEALMDSIPLDEENENKKKMLEDVPDSDHTSKTVLHAEEDEEEEEGVVVAESTTAREMSEPVTATAVESSAASTDEQQQQQAPSSSDETREAWEKLRASSLLLGKVLDDKTGFSYLMSGLKQSAVELDQQVHLSETAKTASESVSSWWNILDSSIGIRQATSDIASSVKEHVQPTIQESTRKLKTLDEQHHVLKSTAESLAKGADYLTQTLSQGASVDEVDSEAEQEAEDTTTGNDGSPSSSNTAPSREHEKPGGANV